MTMFAVLAFIAFLIGLIVHLVKAGFDLSDVTFWLLLGLDLVAAHFAFGWPPGDPRRRP
jgi:hypothetical protein